MSEHIETVIIGGGQAGLTTGYFLKKADRSFVILDANDRLGDQWRRHYDSLVLFTARKFCNLPGLVFPGDPLECPTRDEVAAYVEQYAMHHELPVRTSTRVQRVERIDDGSFRVTIEGGEITCDNVVVAVGKAGQPNTPALAAGLDPSITQLHSSTYRRPSQLPPGRVLVVGASHSGADIAVELAETHQVTLAGRDTGQIPINPDSPRAKRMFPVVVWAWNHVLTRRTPIGRKMMSDLRHHGAPLLRFKTPDLVAAGVDRQMQRVASVTAGKPVLDDGTVVDATTVIWATGFHHTFDFIEGLPLNEDGWPNEYRGVVADVPGLFFCGLIFQYAFGSMVFPGVGRDAAFIADRIAERAMAAKPALAG